MTLDESPQPRSLLRVIPSFRRRPSDGHVIDERLHFVGDELLEGLAVARRIFDGDSFIVRPANSREAFAIPEYVCVQAR